MPIIRVDLIAGRDLQTKQELIRRLTEATSDVLSVPADRIRVLIAEIPAGQWGVGGVTLDRGETRTPAAQHP